MTEPDQLAVETGPRLRIGPDLWIRRICALVVAGVAAYASYQHQKVFALGGGGDHTGAKLWPLSVDGLLLLATLGLLKAKYGQSWRSHITAWVAFLLAIVVSLAANIAAAPTFAWQPVLVAGWPPVALLLAVKLLAHRGPSAEARIDEADDSETETDTETADETDVSTGSPELSVVSRPSAQQVMWEHYVQEQQQQGRVPTGAELDRVAGTNNYGNRVLCMWREQGLLND
ncbi:MAG TPA: DUF2637 domain-containing protein [Mycobacteriales bacterium]|nr:DUF2637 domain-containing protein [Mycobacteriales bacterium]